MWETTSILNSCIGTANLDEKIVEHTGTVSPMNSLFIGLPYVWLRSKHPPTSAGQNNHELQYLVAINNIIDVLSIEPTHSEHKGSFNILYAGYVGAA